MDYTVFATGPRGETIYENASGFLFYSTGDGKYIPVRREEDVRMSFLGAVGPSVTKDDFYTSGDIILGNYIVDPMDCRRVENPTMAESVEKRTKQIDASTDLTDESQMSSSKEEISTRDKDNVSSNTTVTARPLGSAQGVSNLTQNLSTNLASGIINNSINSTEDVGGYTTDNFSSLLDTSMEPEGVSSTTQEIIPTVTSSPSSTGGTWDFTADSEMQDALSTQLMASADKFDSKVSLMYREVGNLSSAWVGEDYDAYCNATNGYKTALGDLSDSIRMYGKHFEKMADATEELTTELIEIVETCTHRHVG